jgi:hypothetical protein
LPTIPGVSDLTAQVTVSEIGTAMSRFPTAGHLVSWAGHDEGAGKRRSARLRNGVPWLKTTLMPCAGAASRKANYLQAQFQRLRQRRGRKKPSAPSSPRSSPPPITGCVPRFTKISAPTTSAAHHRRPKQSASPDGSPTWASPAHSHLPQPIRFLFRSWPIATLRLCCLANTTATQSRVVKWSEIIFTE